MYNGMSAHLNVMILSTASLIKMAGLTNFYYIQ